MLFFGTAFFLVLWIEFSLYLAIPSLQMLAAYTGFVSRAARLRSCPDVGPAPCGWLEPLDVLGWVEGRVRSLRCEAVACICVMPLNPLKQLLCSAKPPVSVLPLNCLSPGALFCLR
jgi:hypothetical protein